MNDNLIRGHAVRLIQQHNEFYEFSDVYEDEALEDASRADQIRVYEAMQAATVIITL